MMKISLLALATGMALLVPSIDVSAKDSETAAKVERIEREVRALQRKIYGVDANGNVKAPADANVTSDGDRELMADLTARLGSLERQLRTMTGRLEEIEYKQRQFDDALELMRREMALQRDEMAQAQANMQQASATIQSPPVAAPTPAPDAKPAIELPAGDPAAQYQYAFAFIQKNDLESGRIAMEKFLAANKKDALAGNAKFWLGRIYMRQGKSAQAAQQLLALIEEHPNHDKRADALVDLSEVLLDLGSAQDSCNALAEFRRSEGKASDRLKARAAELGKKAKCS